MLADVLDVIDSAVTDRVLVFGSLPPEARDLDVLARRPEVAAAEAELARCGFSGHRGTWVRFRSCSAEAIDLVAADEWDLPAREVASLFAEARPLVGTAHVVRPAPHHLLLILARQLVEGDGRLSAKRRARIAAALAEDPEAWRRARRHAAAWRLDLGLELLRGHHDGHGLGSPLAVLRARRQHRGQPPEPPWRAGRRAVGALARSRRGRRGTLISLSGLDGAGKTSQAEALCRSLEALGIGATVAWTRLGYESTALLVVAHPVKVALRLLRAARRPGPVAGPDARRDARDAEELRRRSRVVAYVWSVIVALTNAAAQRRATGRHLRAGLSVVCDRYTLDSAVHLHHRYAAAGGFAVQVRLVHLLSPRPRLAYFLDVAPETALARKPDQFDIDDLRSQARLYRVLHAPLGVRRLDGEAGLEEVCAEIAREAWAVVRETD